MDKQIDILINKTISDQLADNKVLVFPLQCGLGKSSYIRKMIQDRLLSNEGLIVVTDSLAGLKSLAGLPPTDKSFIDYIAGLDAEQREIVDYLAANRDRVAYLDGETVKTELPKLYGHNGKPIILMSTQRYFSLFADDIVKLTVTRPMIVFDEMPYLTEQRKITIEKITSIEAALKMAIDNTANQANKQYLLNRWEQIRSFVYSIFDRFENETKPGDTIQKWYEPKQIQDCEFLHLVNETYRAELDRYSYSNSLDIRRDIAAVFQMLEEGATFFTSKRTSSKARDGSKYDKYFMVMMDNHEKLTNIEARVVVFDGTADIHPNYDLDYIEMVDCSNYKRKLDNLTIYVIDCNTSKRKLSEDHSHNDGRLLKAISNDICARFGNPVVFCHMERARELQNQFSRVNYFGNIKGRNEYRDADCIIQIGVNRYPDYVYRLTAFHNSLFSSEIKPKRFIKVVGNNWIENKTADTMNRMLLADIEQNLFRGAIRNKDFSGKMTYAIYANAFDANGEESQLVRFIRARYEPAGATVEVIDAPVIKVMSRKGDTKAQKIIDWIDALPSGTVFKVSDLLRSLKITNTEFQTAKYNKLLKLKLKKMMIPNMKGYYSTR